MPPSSVLRDRGAHFHKCDLQVHTPRDANWTGKFAGAVTPAERRAFADALIADARRKELDALAITDHHDLCLWRVVKDAAREEAQRRTDSGEDPRPITVFPGVELTLSTPPIQALLLFDPNLSDEALAQIWGALGITPIPEAQPNAGDPIPLRTDLDLKTIYRVLDDLVANPEESALSSRFSMATRFILLPHVRKSGHKTLIRDGHYKSYIEMPCVGGYIEGRMYSELPAGNKAILEGRTAEWGYRRIGVFQTSDSRAAADTGGEAEFPLLGRWPTWVKWTAPTAEALRQACLASDSRISHSEPALPRLRVLGVRVSDSKFLGSCELYVNPQFTAFIGGRGTGKSSLLEYIRWALCDDPVGATTLAEAAHELPNYQQRRTSLIEKTLKPFNGVVTVQYEKFGVPYEITRSSSDTTERVLVTSREGMQQAMSGNQVRHEFPVIAYAQKQLSVVGTLPDEVRRLVIDPVRERLAAIAREIEEVAIPGLRAARQRWLRLRQLDLHSAEAQQQLVNKSEQIRELRSRLTDLTSEDTGVVAEHDRYRAEAAWIEVAQSSIEAARGILLQAGQLAQSKLQYRPHDASWPHIEVVQLIEAGLDRLQAELQQRIASLVSTLTDLSAFPDPVPASLAEFKERHGEHEQAYEHAVTRATANAQQLADLRTLEAEAEAIRNKLGSISDEIQTLTTISSAESTDPWMIWETLHQQRVDILIDQARVLTAQAAHAFQVTIQKCGDPAAALSHLYQIVSCGRNIRSADEKVHALAKRVSSAAHPLREWGELIDEFRLLVEARGATQLPPTNRLVEAGFSTANLISLRDGLQASFLEDLRYVSLDDDIVFEFAFGRSDTGAPQFIPFQDASPGQQATVLLRALLGQNGPPLLIDQPEEDLDNEQVNVVAEYIRKTKHHRQLIFVSHNANLVVNGDAELVACFGYRNAGDQTAATVVEEGSIDYEPIRNLVTSVMEGGRAAFDLRRQKYNF